MVLGWRRAFCTSISKDQRNAESPIIKEKPDPDPSPRTGSKFRGFLSNPSTPRVQSQAPISTTNLRCRTNSSSAPQSPKLECKTRNNSRFFSRSTPSSPKSPSTFSLLKSSLGIAKSRCGICLQAVKSGDGTAIFTAECGHSFHFPCVSSHVKKKCSLNCPICNCTWKDIHLSNNDSQLNKLGQQKRGTVNSCKLKVYNDDESLSTPTSGARFNPIFESDETEEEIEEFPGFFVESDSIPLEISLSPESAVVSVGKASETHALVLKLKAPPVPARRAPIDLVTVLDVSRSLNPEKLQFMKKTMRFVISSLSSSDRLSIVAFSVTSKRLLPLRRMNSCGKRAARRIIDAVVSLNCSATRATDSLKKAAKVIEDRREKNPAASIFLFNDGERGDPTVSSTRFTDFQIPIHSFNLSACAHAPFEDTITKYIENILSVAIQDLKIQLRLKSGSSPAQIAAVYSQAGRPACIGSGSNWCRVGEFHSDQEKELLVELKVPLSLSFTVARRVLSVRCSYKDPSTRHVYDQDRSFIIPDPRAIRSSTRDVEQLRNLFVATRAGAESRRLVESVGPGSEDRAEALTPTSAWRAAERLAKLAIMRKSMNRVGDLHGFENARF